MADLALLKNKGPELQIAIESVVLSRDLAKFAKPAFEIIQQIDFDASPLTDLLSRYLQAAGKKAIKKLLINLPPSCGKSTFVSVILPAWIWSWNPGARFFCAGYDHDMGLNLAVAHRQLVESDWYRERWGDLVQLDPEEKQKSFFRTRAGGYRLSTTRGRRGTGYHPDYRIIDEPLSVAQAMTKRERMAWVEWYTQTVSSRGIARDPVTILAMQRLHPEDPSQYALDENEAAERAGRRKTWHHLCLPMEFDPSSPMEDEGFGADWRSEEGELLSPAIVPQGKVDELKATLGPVGEAAQLKQKPTHRSGQMFHPERMKQIKPDQLPEMERVVRYVDRAASKGQGAYTAMVLMGIRRKQIFIIDVLRGQWDPDEAMSKMYATAAADAARFGHDKYEFWIEEEGGSGGKIAARDAQRRLAGFRVKLERATSGKETRAEPLSFAVSFGEVYIVVPDGEAGYWVADFFDEMRDFPDGTFKDQIDAAGGGYRVLVLPAKGEGKTDMAKSSSKVECLNDACVRPAARGNEFCCDCCRIMHAEGLGEGDHTEACQKAWDRSVARQVARGK